MALYFYPPSFIIWLAGLAISTLWRRPSSSPTPPSWLLDITHNPAVTTATDTTVTTIHWQHNYLYTTKSTVRIVVGALVDGYVDGVAAFKGCSGGCGSGGDMNGPNTNKTVVRLITQPTYRFIEHARLPVLVLSLGTIDETVAEDVVVYAPETVLTIRRRAREPLHSVNRWRTFWGQRQREMENVTNQSEYTES